MADLAAALRQEWQEAAGVSRAHKKSGPVGPGRFLIIKT